MKLLANCITTARIVLSLTLLFINPLSLLFTLLYIICGLSDLVDGPIARKTGAASRNGAKLDSVADLVMICVVFLVLFPLISPPAEVIIWVALIFIIRSVSIVISYVKYKAFVILHTYGNKLTGLLLFVFPISLPYVHTPWVMYIICAVASVSAIEELIIGLTSNEPQPDRKSFFQGGTSL